MIKEHLNLFWWSETRLMGKAKENYGDLLSKYLVEKISDKEVRWVQPKKIPWYKPDKKNFLSTGSIIHHATKHSIVWGSGIIDRNQNVAKADFRSVRGPETRKFLLEQGYECPEVYGDPALLLSDFYNAEIKKKYQLGIIPHYTDFKEVHSKFSGIKGIKVIDVMTNDIEEKTNEILSCEKIVSSSLHGVIVPHSFRIPALWIKFSDKAFGDGIKYLDYYRSLGEEDYKILNYNGEVNIRDFLALFDKRFNLPDVKILERIKMELIKSCPFL